MEAHVNTIALMLIYKPTALFSSGRFYFEILTSFLPGRYFNLFIKAKMLINDLVSELFYFLLQIRKLPL